MRPGGGANAEAIAWTPAGEPRDTLIARGSRRAGALLASFFDHQTHVRPKACRQGQRDPDGLGNDGMEPIDRFYRVRFDDSQALRDWALRAVEIAASRSDVPARALPRVVVFIPPKTPADSVAYGYVSEGARNLVSGMSRGVTLDRTAVSIRELPDGLALLLGDASDSSAYEGRRERSE